MPHVASGTARVGLPCTDGPTHALLAMVGAGAAGAGDAAAVGPTASPRRAWRRRADGAEAAAAADGVEDGGGAAAEL